MLLTMMMTVISVIGASVELDLIKISVVRQRGISWIYQGFRQGKGCTNPTISPNPFQVYVRCPHHDLSNNSKLFFFSIGNKTKRF